VRTGFEPNRAQSLILAKAADIIGASVPCVCGLRVKFEQEITAFNSLTETIRTVIYIDAFNLFYGSLKGTPWKWLDLVALFEMLLHPGHKIVKVKYFTAHVHGRPGDASKPQKQRDYLRALQHHRPEIELHLGRFQTRKMLTLLADPGQRGRAVKVLRTEEKATDVNLAVHLVNDAWLDAYDCAVVVSNDSDLVEALRLVKVHHGKQVLLVAPGDNKASKYLKKHADIVRHIGPAALRNSQLPDPIPGTDIRKPQGW